MGRLRIYQLRSFLVGLLALLLALAPASANPTSGGYQLFERVASGISADIQLASLGNFDYHAKTASECCIAPKGGRDSFLDGSTASGDSVYHGNYSTAIGDDAATVNNFNNAINTGNGHNVIVHGQLDYDDLGGIPTVNGRETNPAQISDAVKSNPNYVEGSQVCFASCWSGSSGSAQQLANELGAPVFAPSRPVAWDSQTDDWVFDTDVFPSGVNLPRPDIQPGWQTFHPLGD